jgi:hypothetical protein
VPFTHYYDPDTSVLYLKASGAITDEEAISYAQKVAADASIPSGRLELADFSEANLAALSAEALRRVASVFQRHDVDPGNSRVALVVSGDLGFGLARMYQAFRSESAIELRVFRDLASAREWLGLAPEA